MLHGSAAPVSGAGGLVSIARCAAMLAEAGDRIERSALSRYCDTHGLKRGRQGRETLVDFGEVREHRANSYSREVMSGRPVAPAAPVIDMDPARRIKAAQATQAELDLARDMGEITDIAEVDAGAADAIVAMRAAFAEAGHVEAERLAAELRVPPEQVRVIRAAMKRFARHGQERFAQRMSRALAAANEPADAAHGRLMTLAAHALRLRAEATAPVRAHG